MKIYHNLEDFNAKNPVLTLGTFDGVHLGHKKVILKLNDIARKHHGESVIFTFYPHPRMITSPDEKNLRLLTTMDEKIRLFAELDVDHLIIYPFTKEFSKLSYSDFVKKILVDKINTHCLVVGYDHKFGKNREGGFEYLKDCAKQYGFKIEKLEALLVDNMNVSSTKIRAALQNGDIKTANRYLGYKFMLHGNVVEGRRIGREIGFPTANIKSSDPYKIIPGYGVYAVEISIGNEDYGGMLNIGTRPTFNNNADNRSIEVNIFDFNGDIYNQEITLSFIDKIREEKKFNNVEALIVQLQKDKLTALNLLDK